MSLAVVCEQAGKHPSLKGGGGGYVRWGGLNFREFSRRSPLGDQSVTFRKGIL